MKTSHDVYRQLRQHIDNMPVGFPESESGAEIRLLKHLFTPEEAKIALELSALPEPLERIHKRLEKTGISLKELERTLDALVKKGAILGGKLFEKQGPGKYYSKALLVIGMFELQGKKLTKDFEKDFQEYITEKGYQEFHSKKTGQMRTIPVNKALTGERFVGAYDDAKEIIENTGGKIGLLECICRNGKNLADSPCKHSDIRDTCIAFESMASFLIETGEAREISKKEALEIIETAENAGFVLQPENNQEPNFICCCCGCCCNILTTAKLLPKPSEFFHSNYYAEADADLCGSCLECVDRCQMEALSNDNTGTVVDLDKCIGCGVCAAVCPTGAIELKEKNEKYVPPKNHDKMYQKIMTERYGLLGMLKLAPKMIFKMKI